MNVRKAAYEALGQFCCALHKACQRGPSDPNNAGEEAVPEAGSPGEWQGLTWLPPIVSPALQSSLARAIPSYMQAVKVERERPVVMAVLEALTGVLRTCGALTLQPPGRLSELCNVLKAVLQKKVSRASREQGGRGKRRRAPEDWIVRDFEAHSAPHTTTVERRRRGSPSSAEPFFHRQPVRTLRRMTMKMMTR